MPPRSPLDPDHMLQTVIALPAQIETSWARVVHMRLPSAYEAPDAVVVMGMGGSAIGGDLIASLFAPQLRVPIQVVRDYTLPAWVGPRSLAIASSFSGDTEETLSAFDEAGRRDARRVAVTSGGRLAAAASDAGVPLVEMPAGGQPRAVIGHSLACLLGVLRAAGLIADPSADISASVTAMRALVASPASLLERGPAAACAAHLADRLPFVYAPEDLAPVARRWKTQINENAKCTAAWESLPEMNHNGVAGYVHPLALPDQVAVAALSAGGTPPRTLRRIEVTADLLRRRGVPVLVVCAPPGPRLLEALWLVHLGDLVSVLLAYHYGVDPTEVETIRLLKTALD